MIQQAWDTLQPEEREGYDARGRSEQALLNAQLTQYTAFYADYVRLCMTVSAQPKPEFAPAAVMAAATGQPVPAVSPTVGGVVGAAGALAGSKRAAPEPGNSGRGGGRREAAAGYDEDGPNQDGSSSSSESEEDAGAYVDESDEEWGAARARRHKKGLGVKGGRGDGGGKRPRATASLNSLVRGSAAPGMSSQGPPRNPRSAPNIMLLPGRGFAGSGTVWFGPGMCTWGWLCPVLNQLIQQPAWCCTALYSSRTTRVPCITGGE